MESNQQSSNIFNNSDMFNIDNLSFFAEQNPTVDMPEIRRPQKYINDFDSSLILENIDKKSKNKAVRLNLKINTLEKNLAKINEELELIKLLNLQKDAKRKIELLECKRNVELKITDLKRECNRMGIIYSFFAFICKQFDYRRLRVKFLRMLNQIKKYDKLVREYIKEKKHNSGLHKWVS